MVFYNINDPSFLTFVSFFACFYDNETPNNAILTSKDILKILKDFYSIAMVRKTHLSPESLHEIFEFLNIQKFQKVITVNPLSMRFAIDLKKYINKSNLPHSEFELTQEEAIENLDLNDADVIYINNSLLPDELEKKLLDKYCNLKNGLIVICYTELPINYNNCFQFIKMFIATSTLANGKVPIYIYKLNKNLEKV